MMTEATTSQLKTIRKALKLSTSELALRLGVSQSTVIRLEQSEAKGTISLNTMKRVANALGCKIELKIVPRLKQKTKKSYHGLKRTSGANSRKSSLSILMKNQERELAAEMSQEQRVIRACELSDFARSLK